MELNKFNQLIPNSFQNRITLSIFNRIFFKHELNEEEEIGGDSNNLQKSQFLIDQLKMRESQSQTNQAPEKEDSHSHSLVKNNSGAANRALPEEEDVEFLGGESDGYLRGPLNSQPSRLREGGHQSYSESFMQSGMNSMMHLNADYQNENNQKEEVPYSPVAMDSSQFANMKNLDELISKMQTRLCKPEDTLITRGQQSDTIYFLSKGIIEIYIDDPRYGKIEDEYFELESGGIFGEIGVLLETKRSAYARA